MSDSRIHPYSAAEGDSASPGPAPGGEAVEGNPPRPPELLTLPEAAILTGLSVKALTRRIERGTVPSETKAGRRLVRRGELERLNLIGGGNPGEDGGGEDAGQLVIWRDLYQTTAGELASARAELEASRAALASARAELARVDGALTAAGPFARARQLRHRLAAVRDTSPLVNETSRSTPEAIGPRR